MSLHITPGRIVLVRLRHGWRQPGIVLVGCPEWLEQHRVTVHVFHSGKPNIDALGGFVRGDERLAQVQREVVDAILAAGARVHAPGGFVLSDLPECDPNDEHAVGWFFPPRGEVSR